MNIVLIEVDEKDARAWLAERHVHHANVAIVTPHSRYAARGHSAVAVYATPTMRHEHSSDLVRLLIQEAGPCLMGHHDDDLLMTSTGMA